jgi:hypothetical protein
MSNFTKREIVGITFASIVFLVTIPIIFLSLPKKGDVVIYNCSISEISPDFPLEVKEACRKLRAENILNKPK